MRCTLAFGSNFGFDFLILRGQEVFAGAAYWWAENVMKNESSPLPNLPQISQSTQILNFWFKRICGNRRNSADKKEGGAAQ